MIWNTRSLSSYIKKTFLTDIIRNEKLEIVLLQETFLLDKENFYIKDYKTYKKRNHYKRKGCCILLNKNILASIITLKNNTEGRYIKISTKSKDIDTPVNISSIYLEADGNLNNIPEEIFDSDIIAGDLNQAEAGLIKDGIYHYKGIEKIQTIQINKRISDHDIKTREEIYY